MAAVMVAVGCVLLIWSALTPPFTTVDEPRHVNSIVRLLEGGGWPAPRTAPMLDGTLNALREAGSPPGDVLDLAVLPDSEQRSVLVGFQSSLYDDVGAIDWMNQHPPTYYVIVAATLAPFAEALRWDQFVTGARGVSILLVVGGLAFGMATARMLTNSYTAAVLGGFVVFLVPQFFNVLSLVTNDALAVFAVSGALWFAVRAIVAPRGLSWLDALGVGGFLGLSILTKGTLLVAVPVFALLLVVACLCDARSRRSGASWIRALAALSFAAAIGGWWWVRNIVLYGQLQSSNSGGARSETAFDGYDLGSFLLRVADQLARTTWGSLRADTALPALLVISLTLGLLLAIGIALYGAGGRTRAVMVILALLPLLTTALITANAWRVYWNTGRIVGIQGRYFFPWITILIVTVALVWLVVRAASGRRYRFALASLFVVVPASVQVFALVLVVNRRWEGDIASMLEAGAWRPWSIASVVLLLGAALVTAVSVPLFARPWARRRSTTALDTELRQEPMA
ncbi:glycosyltransferase family 39 protein [Microbacterium sp. NPDC077184]|uniref:ArnT family glycosyltransferase n=1 Tax=Microbacterium sp. NPDC077184 TaxID=3154764 RepID=UPI0034218CFC